MGTFLDILKVAILSLVEGVTEFLPISSTGHLILVNDFIKLSPEAFANAFTVIIQLGAILSVVVLYFDRLNPWSKNKPHPQKPRRYEDFNVQTKVHYQLTQAADAKTLRLWGKVLVACIPAAILGLLFDDMIDAKLMNMPVVTATLFIYGVLILAIERWNAGRGPAAYEEVSDLPLRTAFLIGCFQCLALVPGTSRSAATILGAMILGTSRVAAAEFSFFLAIPTMLGATFLKVIKNLGGFTLYQWILILLGLVLSFIVAYIVIKKFMDYIKRKDFAVFGYYRIGLAAILVVYMLVKSLL